MDPEKHSHNHVARKHGNRARRGCVCYRSTVPPAVVQHSRAVSDQSGPGTSDRELVRLIEEQETYAEIGRTISQSPDINQVYEQFADQVRKLVDFDRIAVALLDRSNWTVSRPYTSGVAVSGMAVGVATPYATSLERYVMESGKTTTMSDSDVLPFPNGIDWVAAGFRSLIATPLVVNGESLGMLALSSKQLEAFDDRAIVTVGRVAAQISGVIRTSQLALELRREAEEKEVLAEIGRAAGSSVDISTVFEKVAGLLRKLAAADYVGLTTLDHGSATATITAAWGLVAPGRQQGMRFDLAGSVTAAVIKSMNPMVIDSASIGGMVAAYPQLQPWASAGVRSIVTVPVIHDDTAIGIMTLASKQEILYGPSEVALLERAASQFAGTVASGRLADRLRRESSSRNAISEIGRAVGSAADISDVFEAFVGHVSTLMPADRVCISTVDASGSSVVPRHVWGVEVPQRLPGSPLPLPGTCVGAAVETRRTQLVKSVHKAETRQQCECVDDYLDAGLLSIIVVPLVVGDKAAGVLEVASRLDEAYGAEVQALAESVAAQIAGAVSNAEARSAAVIAVQERAILGEIGRVAASSLEVREVLDRVWSLTRRLVAAERFVVSVVNVESKTVRAEFVGGMRFPDESPGKVWPLDQTLTQQFVSDNNLSMVYDNDLKAGPMQARQHARALTAGLTAYMAVPLVIRDRVIGTVSFRSRQPGGFNERDRWFGVQIASQIAGAVASAEQYKQARRLADERSVLAEISRELSSSMRIEDVYSRFVALAARLIKFDRVVISTFDEEGKYSVDAHVSGMSLPGYSQGGLHPIAGTRFEHVIAAKASVVVNHALMLEDARFHESAAACLSVGLRSMLMAPMILQGRVIGTVNFRSVEPDPYGSGEIALAEQIAAQIAGTVASSQSYAAADRESEIRKALAAIAVAASSGLDLSTAFESVANELAKLIRYDRLSVALKEPGNSPLKVAFTRGVEIPHKKVGDVIPLENGNAWKWEVALEGDSSGRPDHAIIEAVGLNSRLQVPIGNNGAEVLGYVGLWRTERNAFFQTDVELMQRVSAQVTPAIQNAIVHRHVLDLANARERTAVLELQRQDLERANETKNRFLTTMSHELRTPLTSVISFTDLVARNKDQNLTEKQVHHLDVVRRNARHMRALINDMLDVTRIEAGRLSLASAEFDLAELIGVTAESFMPVMSARRQRLVLEVQGSELGAIGDRDRVMQVVANLISNASKYSKEGTVVRVRGYSEEDYVVIEVIDQGIGISRDDQLKLFAPFYRIDNDVTRAGGGTGLGLSIVKRLVELHGGTISVTSEVGAGSTFTVRIPKSLGAEAAA